MNTSIQAPFIPGLWATPLEGRGELASKADAPVPNALIADGHAPGRQDQLDIPQAETEAVIQPDRMRDNLRRVAETTIGIVGRAHVQHPATHRADVQPDNALVRKQEANNTDIPSPPRGAVCATVAHTLKWLCRRKIASNDFNPGVSEGGLSRGSCFGVATTDAAKINDLG
jgi:hypothetical protein